jgi:peptide/nickel transport system permease protein
MRLSTIRPVALLISKELAVTALLLLGVSFVVFIILYLSPGDPFSVLFKGQPPTEEALEGAGGAISVSASWYSKYLSWLLKILKGDFGTSIRTGLPVLGETVRVGINTLYLTIGSMLVTLAIALPIAVSSARRGLTPLNWSLTMFAYVVSALPVFWLGYIVIYIFTHKFGLFPIAFGFSTEKSLTWLYFVLPILVLGLGNGTVSEIVRYLRQELERVFSEDYIRTARAKGASVWKHSFKEGFLIPVTEIIASKIPFILGGAVVVEQVFNWPGMGRMAWQAAQDRDYPLIMGIAILSAVIVRFGSLVQKTVYILVNPRASRQ